MSKHLRVREVAQEHDFTVERLVTETGLDPDLVQAYWDDQVAEGAISPAVCTKLAQVIGVSRWQSLLVPQKVSDKFTCPDTGVVWL